MGVSGGPFELVVVLNAVFYIRRTDILVYSRRKK